MANRTNKYREAQDLLTRANALREVEVTAKPIVLAKETAKEKENLSDTTMTLDDQDRARDFKFPLTLEEDGFPAKIIFRAVKIDGLDVFEKTGLKKVVNAVLSGYNRITEEKRSSGEEGKTPEETDQIIADSNIKQSELISYENNLGGTRVGSVTLPLQVSLKYNDVATYNTTSLGVIGGATEGALGGQNPFSGATKGDGSLGKGVSALAAQAVTKNIGLAAGAALGGVLSKGIAGAVIGGVAGDQLGEGLGAAVKSATRVASAPNNRTLFETVQIREFGFDFEMIANNKEESRVIRDIITFFRQELYPEKIPLGTSGVPIGYKFPNVFEIEVQNRFGQNPGFKFQRCYLRNVSTTFNEVAKGMFVDGNFIQAAISLSFVEIVALDKQKIRAGY